MAIRHRRNYRPPFDPSREFTVTRPLPVNGVALGSGSPFDKTQVTTRRLRQLYEQRWISLAGGPHAAKAGPRKPRLLAVGPTDLANPGRAGHRPQRVSRVRLRAQESATV